MNRRRDQQVGGGGIRKVGFGSRNKRREGVTRLIKLFYLSNFRIYKFKNLFSIIFIFKQFKICT